MKHYKDILLELIVTCFFIGKIKYAPGTFGSLIAFPISYFIFQFTLFSDIRIDIFNLNIYQATFVTFIVLLLLCVVIITMIGTICSTLYEKKYQVEDPKEIVIDEVAGQMLVIALTSLSVAFLHYEGVNIINNEFMDFIFMFFLPFTLFRIFDISKPFPINIIDQKIKGGLGIMLDDIIAAIFATVVQYFIVFYTIDLFHYLNTTN